MGRSLLEDKPVAFEPPALDLSRRLSRLRMTQVMNRSCVEQLAAGSLAEAGLLRTRTDVSQPTSLVSLSV
jgi:hypothetical protein